MSKVSRLDVISTGARRRWPLVEKQRIVAESYGMPRIVSATARRNGLSASQLFTWRRLAKEGRLAEANGQLLEAQAQVLRSEANQGRTQLDVNRYTPLAKAGGVTEQDLDNAVQANLAAKAEVEAAIQAARNDRKDGRRRSGGQRRERDGRRLARRDVGGDAERDEIVDGSRDVDVGAPNFELALVHRVLVGVGRRNSRSCRAMPDRFA
jgi:transposase